MRRRDFLSCAGSFLLYPAVSQAATKPTIYLTIDDGPNPSMEEILNGLGNDHKATFFVVGRQLENPGRYKLARYAIERGHAVGNHSYGHPFFSRISLAQAKQEIAKTQSLIERIYKEVGKTDPRFFRFPFGDKGAMQNSGSRKHRLDIAAFLQQERFNEYLWDIDSCDWMHYAKGKSVPDILWNIGRAKEGHIVLIHDLPITPKYTIPFVTHHYRTKALERL